jgi:hypothetical protein
MMKEQQRARHCALGLNAYTHTEIRDTRPIIFEREREQSSRPISLFFPLQSDPVVLFWTHFLHDGQKRDTSL